MNKIGKGCLISLVIAAVFIGMIIYNIHFRISTVDVSESTNGEYTAKFQTIGDPGFPYGPVKVRVVVKDKDGHVLDKISSTIANDGGSATKDNWTVLWGEDKVNIILDGEEQEEVKYSIDLQ